MSAEEMLRKLHEGHDCDPGPCQCKCGCRVMMGCRTIISDLCSVCHVKWIRDYEEHGPKGLSETVNGDSNA